MSFLTESDRVDVYDHLQRIVSPGGDDVLPLFFNALFGLFYRAGITRAAYPYFLDELIAYS